MPRNRQGHSSSDTNITAADITKKSVKASVKNTSDADENTPVGPCEAKTVPATKVNKNLLLNGNVESMETLDAYSINSPTNDPNIKCDIEKKFENCNTSGESKVYAPQSNSHCVDDVDMTVEGTELSDVSESISISTVDVNNVQSRVADSTTCSPKSNSAFPNGDIDIQQSELTSQSGLWPEVSTMSSHTSESHQLGYRLSTTIMETKMSSDEMPTNIIAQKPQVTNEQNNCRLPSSVYGQSSASNIEKVLTGLQFAVQADNMPKQDDVLQKGNNRESMENTLSFKNAMEGHVTLENDSGFSKSPKVAHKEMEKTELENGSRNKNSQSKLKINIPEISNSESSEQSIPESKKTLKFPKITSPQILEQHISKIISENAAIVNTLDPLWSKQYMRQSSLSYNQTLDTEGRKGSFSNKIRRMSEDKTNILASGESNPSKLQSALLGTLETKSTIGSTDAIGVPYVPSSAVFLAMTTTCTPTYTLTKTITSVMEEELKGNAIKSLLSLKQGRFSENNMFKFDNDKFDQHPQNPEGSIIKDLLLNTKSKTKLSTYTETENSVVCANPSLDLMCIGCGLKFLTQDILEAHSSVCKGPKNNKTASKVIKDNKTNGMSHLNCDPLDKVQVSLPVLNPRALSNSIEVLLKNENSYDGVNADIGPILKKQLLSPFINQKESTLKKRKISDSALSMNKSSVYNELKGENSCDSKKNITINQSSENVTVLSHRSRSQSMHLFGGEVQILDGAVAKKIKISTSLSETVPSATMSVLNNMSYAKCSFYEIQEVKTSSVPLQTVVVTIAQPVHNSGGTVTHIPSQNSPPSLSALMNLPNDVSSSDDIKCSDLSPSVKNWGSIFPAKDLSPITAVNNLTKFSVIQKPSSAVTKVTVANKQPFRVFSTANVIKPLAALSFKPIRENATSSFSALTKLDSCGSPGKSFLPFKSTFSTLGLGITSSAEHSISGKHECKNEIMPFQYLTSRPTAKNIIKSSVPTVLLTPSSPHSFSDEEQNHSDEDGSNSEKARKLLAPSRPNPMRPNSLLLTKKPFTMVGSTLISPETPRPKKNCVQMYINGQAYTYLGLKCSTRSTYCCIYRPQPMFVLQETDPKLSMYSNWQVVPSKEELAGLTPGQMIALYNSKQSPCNSEKLFTTSKMGELLSFTHSSYWTFRSKERDKTDAQLSTNIDDPYSHFSTDVGGSDSSYPEFIQSTYGNCITDPFSYSDNAKTGKRDGRTSSVSDNTSSLDVEASLSDADVNNSQDEDDDDDDERADVLTDSSQSQAPKRVKIFEGGFKSNEDYTYVRGRGRGKYVCEECGIRCKKPSMLKKHIRTHTDLRPYKCRHCSFAFKTKGNLTKHMKSKAHHKKCTELGIVPVPTSTDDYQIDEEALAKQEQLKKRNLPFSDGESIDEDDDDDDDDFDESDGLDEDCESDTSSCIMSMNTNSKLSVNNFCETESGGNVVSGIIDETITTATEESIMQRTVEQEAARSLLHLSSLSDASEQWPSNTGEIITVVTSDFGDTTSTTLTPITSNCLSPVISHKGNELSTFLTIPEDHMGHRPRSYSADIPFGGGREQLIRQQQAARTAYALVESTAKEAAESLSKDSNPRRYSISVAREARKPRSQTVHWGGANTNVLLQKWPEIENAEQPMDLRVPRSIPTIPGKHEYGTARNNVITLASPEDTVNVLNTEIYLSENFTIKPLPLLSSQVLSEYDGIGENSSSGFGTTVSLQDSQQSAVSAPQPPMFYTADRAVASVSAGRKEGDPMDDLPSPEVQEFSISSPVSPSNLDDNCFTPEIMIPSNLAETLQASSQLTSGYTKPGSSNMEEGKCVCRICNKIFAKAGQLRIHVNIHYFERPFRCDNCGVSFRTKGHLQKHKRSVSHYNKVNMNMTFGTPSIDNPRPFKCADCKIAFRIHGHLAKHLRSKMHIMKLECLGKLPFGMYAEMERSGVSLNEIDTTDCNNSLESLQVMAQKLYQRDPRRMRWQSPTLPQTDHETQKCPTSTLRIVDAIAPVPEPIPITHSSPSVISVPSTVNLNIPVTNPEGGEVKCEPSDVLAFATTPTFAEAEVPAKTSTVLFANQNIAVSSPQPMVRADVSEAEANTTLHRSDTCHICGRMFKSTKFLQVHLYCDHSSWNPPAKEIATPSKTIIDSASNSSGANVVQELACDLCGRHFSNQNSLQQHLLTHAQPRPFVCEVCDAGFTSSSSLVAHLATHQQVNSSTAASTEGSLLQLQ